MSATVEPPKPQKLNGKQIMPFVNSTIRVFTTMVNVKPEIVAPRLKEDNKVAYDVSGIIGFSGEVIGTVVLSFQMAAAQALVNAMTCMTVDPAGPDFTDAIGELANMIAGSAKSELGHKASITVPTVIIGKNHIVGRLSGVPCVQIPCKTPVGDFAVEVNIKPTT